MSFIQRMLVLLYVSLVLFLSCFILLVIFGVIDLPKINYFFYTMTHIENLRIAWASIAGALIVINFAFFKIYTVNVHRDKTIAFDNPSGRVVVSLFALEDLIKRTVIRNTLVRDCKPSVVVTNKGLQIKIKIALQADVNIPETALEIQNLIVRKVQDVIGITEPISVFIVVGRIVVDQPKDKSGGSEKLEPNIPFQGYRA
jgi:uncharacterized alkaline shock family protein YloU